MIKQVFASDPDSFLGTIKLPDYLERFTTGNDSGGAIIVFANMLIRVFFIVAGLYAVWQFIMAGWTFILSAGDPKKIESAKNMILMTLVGLLVMAASVVFAAIAGILIFGKWDAILNPTLTGVDGT